MLLQIDERRARLCGLDAPRRAAVTVISDDVLDSEIAKLTANLERRETAPLQLEAGWALRRAAFAPVESLLRTPASQPDAPNLERMAYGLEHAARLLNTADSRAAAAGSS